ncbi:MAG TPA: tryptophan synthase subunit alpha, partial [Bacteroidota bacterium]|nr:tryptophan synthase subunit alpha [Bacteroidota bacterium]
NILLVAPTTPTERIRGIDAASSGFLYCVSTTGVTGEGGKRAGEDFLTRVRSAAACNPVLVGFGISTPGEAAAAAGPTDGVIIGSALLKRILAGESEPSLGRWVRAIRGALDHCSLRA